MRWISSISYIERIGHFEIVPYFNKCYASDVSPISLPICDFKVEYKNSLHMYRHICHNNNGRVCIK